MPVVAMKFELDDNPLGTNRITAYSAAGVVVSDTCYSNALIVTPDTVIPDWPPRVLADIALQHMQQLLQLQPEIILLGTGSNLCFPAQELLHPVQVAGVGVEVMDTGAACRAYNFLSAEGRRIVAALLPIDTG